MTGVDGRGLGKPALVQPRIDQQAFDQQAFDATGWVAITGLLAPNDAAALAERCTAALAALGIDFRVGDKVAAGTRRLTTLTERVPDVRTLFDDPAITAVVEHVLGSSRPKAGALEPGALEPGALETRTPEPDVTFRSPLPGYGGQLLHADAVPLTTASLAQHRPFGVVTAIVALCDFDTDNGATGIVPGSHRRPDLQRQAGRLDHHDDELILTGPAGTAFVINGHLLHRGRRNNSDRPRPALQAMWRMPETPRR